MRTISKVHTPSQRQAMRLQGERRARQSMIRLVAAVSILRTALTDLLPLAGSAGWWVVPVCLLPGLTVYGLLALTMKRTGTAVLADCLGRLGDERALPLLKKVAASEETPYLDYIELRSAIEALGGDAPEREFDAEDPAYEAMRSMQ